MCPRRSIFSVSEKRLRKIQETIARIDQTACQVDAEAAWKYVMENPTGAQKDQSIGKLQLTLARRRMLFISQWKLQQALKFIKKIKYIYNS